MTKYNTPQVLSTSQLESLSKIRQQRHDNNHYHLQALKALQHSLDTLAGAVDSLQIHHTSQHHTNHPGHVHFPLSNITSPSMGIEQSNLPIFGHQFLLKVDLPKFDGKDPHAWIFRSQEFFEDHNVPLEQRLSCVSFMVHGEASEWFHWMKSNGLLRLWDDFLVQVKFRFDPVYFEDFTVPSSKLHQVPIAPVYQAEYEKLPPITPNVLQHHEVGYLEHPIEYFNTKPANGLDVELTVDEHVTLSQDHPSLDVMEVLQNNTSQESGSSQSHDHTHILQDNTSQGRPLC